jgi:hypothetical protein
MTYAQALILHPAAERCRALAANPALAELLNMPVTDIVKGTA